MRAIAAPFVLPIVGKPIEKGLVILDDSSRIFWVGPREKSPYQGLEIEEFPQSVLMPGLVNAHTHLDLLYFNDATPDFFDWLIKSWEYRKRLSLAERRHALEEGIRQLVSSGTTTVGDAGQYAGLFPQAASSPIRMVLFPELLVGSEPTIPEGYQGAFNQVEEIQAAQSRKTLAGIAPYAPYTLSRHLLKIIAQQAGEEKIPIKIHVAETFAEMQFFFESKGEIAEKLFPQLGWGEQIPPPHRKTPIQFLESIGFLGGAPTLIGCNHLADPDLGMIAKSGSKVVHSPRTNAHLKLGHPPLKKMRSAGIPVGLGTDGTASRHSLSLWDEMRFIQEHYPKTHTPSPHDLLTMATLEGARSLGLEKRIGSLEAGKEADLIAIKLGRGVTAKDLPSWLIDHVTEREITAVFVEGKRLKIA